jgi:hypothetical protein
MKIFRVVWIAVSVALYLCLSFVIGGRGAKDAWDAGFDTYRQQAYQYLFIENNALLLGFFTLHLCVTLLFFWREVESMIQRLGRLFIFVCTLLLLIAGILWSVIFLR